MKEKPRLEQIIGYGGSTMHNDSPILLNIVSRLADMQQQIVLMKTCQDKSNMEIQSMKKDLANISSFLIPRMTHSEANRNGPFGIGFQGPDARETFPRHPGAYMANQYWPSDPRSAQLYNGPNPFLMYGQPFVYPGVYYKPATSNKEYEHNTHIPSTTIPQKKTPAPPSSSFEGLSKKQSSSNLEVSQQDLDGKTSYSEQTFNGYKPTYKRDRQISSTSSKSAQKKKVKKVDNKKKPDDSVHKKNKLPSSCHHDTDEERQARFEDNDLFDELECPKNDTDSISGLNTLHVSPKKPTIPEVKHIIQKSGGRQMLNSKATLAQGDFFALASSKKATDTSLNSITSENPIDYNNNVTEAHGTPPDPRSRHAGEIGTKRVVTKEETSVTLAEKSNDDSERYSGHGFDRKKSIIVERETRPKGIWEMNPISNARMFNFEKNSKQVVKEVPNQFYRGPEHSRAKSISSGISCLSATDNVTDSEDEAAIDQILHFEYMKEKKSSSDLKLTAKEIQTSFNNNNQVVDLLLENQGLSDKQLVKLEA